MQQSHTSAYYQNQSRANFSHLSGNQNFGHTQRTGIQNENNNNSYFTSTQGQFYPTNYTCEEHPNEPITNYCSNLECLKELCPECIDAHFKFHQQTQTIAEIESIKNVKINCSKKLKAAVHSLTKEMDKTEIQYLTNPDLVIEENVARLHRCQERVQQMVQNYFESLEMNYRKKVHENVLKSNDFSPIFEQIRSLIQELEVLNTQLDTGNTVSVIRKICLLDLQRLMEKFRKDIHKVIDSKDLDPVHIEINDQKQSSLQQELAALVKIVQMESNYHQGHQNQLASPSGQFRDQTIISPSANRSGFGQGSVNQSQIPVPVKLKPQSQLNIDQDQETGAYELNLQTNKTQLEVNLKDYFLPDCQRKYLHFFVQEEDCTKLYYCDVEQDKTRYQEIKLGPDQFAPDFHKSIILPNGDIYLIGGTSLSGQKSNQISKFDWNSKELVPVAEMKYPRSSHALAYLNEKIYIIGGYTTNADKKSSLTKSVEEFDISTKRVRQVASLNQGVVSAAATGFNGKYLFKFGGMTEQRQMSAVIEKYDPQFDTWSVIDPRISPQPLQILSTGCCGQINESQIMVFGGYNQDNYSSRQCFLFQVDENNDGNCAIKCINWKPLPVQEGFWNNQAFVWRGVLYAQQNVTSENQVDCKQNERHVLGFQGDDWLVLNQH